MCLQGHKVHTKAFSKKTEAQKWAKRVEFNLEAGQWVPAVHSHTPGRKIPRRLLPLKRNNKDARHTVAALLNWWKNRIGDCSLVRVATAVLMGVVTSLHVATPRAENSVAQPRPIATLRQSGTR